MDGAKLLHQLAIIVVLITSLIQIVDSREYCQFDIFNASCAANQVILIDEARYGRLQLGRCVTRDYGYIGCSASVVDLLDRACSGRRTCRFSVPTLRELVQPCPKDLTSYLDVTYQCVTVFDVSATRCNATVQLDDANPTTHMLLSPSFSITSPRPVSVADLQHSARSTPTGTAAAASAASSPSADPSAHQLPATQPSASCPSTFTVRSGQRIAITLYSFRAAGVNDNSVPDVAAVIGGGGGNRGPGVPSSQASSDGAGGVRNGAALLSSTAVGYCSSGSLVVVDGPTGTNVAGRRRVIRLCDVRQHREQVIMMTNSSVLSVYFDGASVVQSSSSSSVAASASGTTKVTGVIPKRQQQKSDQQSDTTVDTVGSRGRTIYVVKFEATGCADLEPPINARIDRYDDSLVVKCNLSQETWYLTCKGTTWIGTITNCSEGVLPHNEEIGLNTVAKRRQVPFGLWMAVAIGIGLGVVFGFIMLITVFIYRRCKMIRSPPKLNVLLGPCDETVLQDTTTPATTTISSSSTYGAHVEDYYITCSGGGRRMIYADPSTIELCSDADRLHSAPPSRSTYMIANPPLCNGWTDPPPLPPPELYFAAAFRRRTDYQAAEGSTPKTGGTDSVDGVSTKTSIDADVMPMFETDEWTINGNSLETADSVSKNLTHAHRVRGASVGGSGGGRGRSRQTLQLNKRSSVSVAAQPSRTQCFTAAGECGDNKESVDYGRLGVNSLNQSPSIAVLLPSEGARRTLTRGLHGNDSSDPTVTGLADDRRALPLSNTVSCFTVGNSVRFAKLVDGDRVRQGGTDDDGGELSKTAELVSGDERPDLVRDGRRQPPQWHYHSHNQPQQAIPGAGVTSLAGFAMGSSDQQHHHHQHYEAQPLNLPQQRPTPYRSASVTTAGVTFRDWQESPVLNI